MQAATSAVEQFTTTLQVKGVRGLQEYLAFTGLSVDAIADMGTAHGDAIRQMYEHVPPGASFWDPVIKFATLAYETYDKFTSAIFWVSLSSLMNTLSTAISNQAAIVYDSFGAIRNN